MSAVVVAVLAGAGCSSVNSADVAASVNGVELSQGDFEAMLVQPAADGEDARTTTVDAGTARDRLSSWTILAILQQQLEADGKEVGDDDRQAAATQLQASDPNWATSPTALQNMLIDLQATATVWASGNEPTDEALVQASYEEGIEASGVACVAHILVETEAEAQAILDELADGGDFATLAAEHTTDTGSAASGGALPCSNSTEFQSNYTPPFVDAALAADVGEPVGPVATDFGYHLVLLRPYDDVADDVISIYDGIPARFRRVASAADVRIDPRYGTFDPNQGVIPLG